MTCFRKVVSPLAVTAAASIVGAPCESTARVRRRETELADRVAERRLGDFPEVGVGAHQRPQPRVLELLLPPRGREGHRIARDLAARLDHRVHVEERAVGVEDVAADRAHREYVVRRARAGRLGAGLGSDGASSPASTKPYFKSFFASRNDDVRVREPSTIMMNCWPSRHAETARL